MPRPIPHAALWPGRARRTQGLIALCLLLLAPAAAARQERSESGPQPLVTMTFTLRHQSAAEAVHLVFPYLSESGTLEVRPGGNTLVVRDTRRALERIGPLLRDFDHPARLMVLDIQVVSAGSEPETAGERPPEELLARLRQLLRYKSYRLVAKGTFRVGEGAEVSYPLSEDYEVAFRLGVAQTDRRIKLHSFRVLRRRPKESSEPLIHTNVNLWLERPMVLGLARTEASERALMIVLNCRAAEERAD